MKKSLKILIPIIVILIAIRIALPYIAKSYLNKTLANLEEYKGHVYDVDISLIRGAYVIDSLIISKRNSSIEKPFFTSDKIDISLEWKSLFNGAIVGEFVFTKPTLNFIMSKQEDEKQYGDDENWVEPLKSLLPIQINNLKIVDGEIFLYDYNSKNPTLIFLKEFNADFANMSNVVSTEELLPSNFKITATSIGGGKLNTNGKINFLKKVPDIDYNFTFENVDIVALNDFLRSSANIDAESGNFNLYHELAINDSEIKGYVKPIIKNLKIFKWKEEDRTFGGFLKEAGADLIADIFKNHKKNQFATKVPINGSLKDPKLNSFKALLAILENTFIKALKNDTDNSIIFSDINN